MDNQLPRSLFVPSTPSFTPTSLPPTLPVKKKHWIRRIIIVLICIIVALLIIITNIPRILNVFYHDIPSIDDSDLTLQKISLPDSINGYVDLTKAVEAMYAPKEMMGAINDMSGGKNWDIATATELISKNTQALAYFDQAAHKPQFQWPLTADPANLNPSMILTPLGDWRKMSQLSSIYAIALSKQGKDAAAMEVAFDSVRVGHHIQDSQNVLITYLVGLSMKTTGLNAVQKIASTSKMTAVQMMTYINEMNQYMNDEAGLVTAFKAEYHNQTIWLNPGEIAAMLIAEFNPQDMNVPQENLRGMTPSQYASIVNNSYYFQPNKTKLLFANNTRDMISNAPSSCGLTKLTQYKPLTPTNPIRFYLEPNIVGEILVDIMGLSLNSVNRVKCEDQARMGETQILLALKAYKDSTKSLPASLDQLVPTYLSIIPTDPFSKQLLQYSLTTKTIYSTYSTSTIPVNF